MKTLASGAQLGDPLGVEHRTREELEAGVDELRLQIGAAVLEMTGEPHTGCRKFVARFGPEAMRFVGSAVGRSLNLIRGGAYSRVVVRGTIRVTDVVRPLPPA